MSEAGARADGSPDRGGKLTAGQLVRRRLLGSEALYRVVGQNVRGVEVEVVQVEGLAVGSRFTFALVDVLSMDLVDPSESDAQLQKSPAKQANSAH